MLLKISRGSGIVGGPGEETKVTTVTMRVVTGGWLLKGADSWEWFFFFKFYSARIRQGVVKAPQRLKPGSKAGRLTHVTEGDVVPESVIRISVAPRWVLA